MTWRTPPGAAPAARTPRGTDPPADAVSPSATSSARHAEGQRTPPPERAAPYSQGRAPGDAAPPGVMAAAKHFLVSLAAHLRTRLELLGVELAQEKMRLMAALMLGAVALVMGILGLVLAVMLVVAATWNTPWRLPALGALCVVALLASVVLAIGARRRLLSGAQLFQSSLRELTRDQQWFDRMH